VAGDGDGADADAVGGLGRRAAGAVAGLRVSREVPGPGAGRLPGRAGESEVAVLVAMIPPREPAAPRASATAVRPLLSGLLLRSQTDERLMALAREGHDQAFVTLVERYRRELIAHARRLVAGDRSEDVMQQAMLGAWGALRRQAEVQSPRAWLHRIVHNVALLVAQRTEEHEQLSDSLASSAGTHGEVEQQLAAAEALAALVALPEPQRRALELTALEGRSGREAAVALGVSESALRQLVHRARAALRAGPTALMPAPLLAWAASGTSQPVAARIGELSAGAGIAATLAKVAATVAVTATVIGGATQIPSGGHAPPTQHHNRPAAQHSTPGNEANPTATAAGQAGASVAPATLPENPDTVKTVLVDLQTSQPGGQQGQQQQPGPAGGTGTSGQSHQSGINEPGATPGSTPAGTHGQTSTQGTTGNPPNRAGAQGPAGAQGGSRGINQP
jgi:RNA polymerase sigma factor (sigma-70 family)